MYVSVFVSWCVFPATPMLWPSWRPLWSTPFRRCCAYHHPEMERSCCQRMYKISKGLFYLFGGQVSDSLTYRKNRHTFKLVLISSFYNMHLHILRKIDICENRRQKIIGNSFFYCLWAWEKRISTWFNNLSQTTKSRCCYQMGKNALHKMTINFAKCLIDELFQWNI